MGPVAQVSLEVGTEVSYPPVFMMVGLERWGCASLMEGLGGYKEDVENQKWEAGKLAQCGGTPGAGPEEWGPTVVSGCRSTLAGSITAGHRSCCQSAGWGHCRVSPKAPWTVQHAWSFGINVAQL